MCGCRCGVWSQMWRVKEKLHEAGRGVGGGEMGARWQVLVQTGLWVGVRGHGPLWQQLDMHEHST